MAEINYIVRVMGKDLDGTKRVDEAIQSLKGISHRMGGLIWAQFRKEHKSPFSKKLGELTPEEVKQIESIITGPEKHGLPIWTLNRQNDYATGEDKHLIMNDLAFSLRNDLQRMAEIKSYRGLRLMWGLPVRGQKTKSTHRGKGGIVGVTKKDAGKPAVPAKASSAAPAKPAAKK
ncbi:MAG: 30S ribosomal protein S13 [archaeon]